MALWVACSVLPVTAFLVISSRRAFLALLEPYLGHFGSDKWATLVSLDVLSAVSTWFIPVPLKIMVLRPTLPILSILASFCHFWSPWAYFPPFSPDKRPNMVCPLFVSNLVLSIPTKYRPIGPCFVQKDLFSLFGQLDIYCELGLNKGQLCTLHYEARVDISMFHDKGQ